MKDTFFELLEKSSFLREHVVKIIDKGRSSKWSEVRNDFIEKK